MIGLVAKHLEKRCQINKVIFGIVGGELEYHGEKYLNLDCAFPSSNLFYYTSNTIK